MKTRYSFILSLFTAVLAFFTIVTGTVNAQNFVRSDTINFQNAQNTNSAFYLQDFGFLKAGDKKCHTIFLKNSTGGPMIVNTVIQSYYSSSEFTVTAIPTFPTILLNGEIVSIVDLCYQPTTLYDTMPNAQITIQYTIGGKLGAFQAAASGHQIRDTLLSKPFITLTMDGDIFGPVIMDGDASLTATLTSNRREDIQVRMDTAIYNGNGYFHVSGINFPYTLTPQEVKNFTITYSPRSNVPVVQWRSIGLLSLQASDKTEADYPKLTLPGVAIPPTADSISTALNAGSTDILAMIGDNSVTTKTFHFTNTGTTNLKITGVDLKNKVSFAITDIQPTSTLPFTLKPGESMSVTVAMTTVNNGVYYDEVIITAEQGIISMNFELQGLRKNGIQAGVSASQNAMQHVTLYPNPSHGDITIAIPGVRNAKIEVLDVLGKIVAEATASEMWNWKSTAPAGTYVVHVSGTDESGKTFQSYDRFIIQK